MIQVAMQTNLNMEELRELGFSMYTNSKKGWIYHVQASDEPLNINIGSDNEVNLNDANSNEIIEAIEYMFNDSEDYEKLKFLAELTKTLA